VATAQESGAGGVQGSRPRLSAREMLKRHEATQAGLPASRAVRRPIPRGRRVAVFVIPLELCKPQDARRHAPGWLLAADRTRILGQWLRPQWLLQPLRPVEIPLRSSSRPQVLCCRYSTTEPDAMANWCKQAVDCLQPGGVRRGKPFHGIGLIRSDKPSECEVVEWWEPAKRGEGFCAVEVWSG
jgi:hypothetical protein